MTKPVTPAAAAPTAVTEHSTGAIAGQGELATMTLSLVRGAKKVQESLTIQGAAVIAAAQYVGHNAPAVLADLGLKGAVWPELTGDVNQLLMAAGLLMVAIGRLRLGDLR